MKNYFTHICLIIDESGSMYDSISSIKEGFKKIIAEQKANTDGTCAVSMYTFDDTVTQHFLLKDINDIVPEFNYNPGGKTALNDAVGKAIDEIGQKLAEMEESERPSSNLIVIMSDGEENNSKNYTLSQIRGQIKHQTTKYNWTFIYLGVNLVTSHIVDSLGIIHKSYSSKKELSDNYAQLNIVINEARKASAEDAKNVINSAVCRYSASLNKTLKI